MESDTSGVSGEGERDAGAVAEEEEEDMPERAQGGKYYWLVVIKMRESSNRHFQAPTNCKKV